MLDGQRLNNPQTGQVDLSSLRVDGIEKIEIKSNHRDIDIIYVGRLHFLKNIINSINLNNFQ